MKALNESRLKVADEFRDIDPEERSDVRAIALVSQVQGTRMNLGTLTQFEQSENYVPKYLESSL